jgi:drug/metabolite transporter (DMT)-like permease
MNSGFIYAIGAAVTWGLVYTIDQKILLNTSPIALLFLDSIITAIIILPFMFFDHGAIKTLIHSGKSNITLIILSIVFALLANFFIFSAIKSIGASSASIIEIAYPFFVVLFSIIFFQVAPSLPFFIGGLLIFIGSAIITYFH